MANVRLDGSAIVDWDSFHTICAREFGFPDFYGRNGNAWIDCLSYINEGDGMSRFVLKPGELLRIEVAESEIFRERHPEILQALVDWTGFVNERSVAAGDQQRLQLAFL
jgi:RNAse (barnase) inhibitor barstar